MKTHTIEIQKFKAASNSNNGLVMFKVDALLTPRTPVDGIEPSNLLTMTEGNARVALGAGSGISNDFEMARPIFGREVNVNLRYKF